MRRTTDINHAFDFVRRSVDQSYRIRSYRHDGQCLGIWRVTETVNKKLTLVERTQSSRDRIAESNHSEQFVLRGINYRDCVRGLIRSVHTIATRACAVWS